jgi:hypothetical protein
MSKIKKEFYEQNPEAAKEQGEGLKQHYIDNPDARAKCSNSQKKYYEDNPVARQECRERTKQFFEDNPKARKEHGEKMKKYFENPESKRRIADTKGQNKPFDVSMTDGTFIKTFTYQFEALEYLRTELQITSTIKIGEVLRVNRSNSAGFVFKYK